MIRFVFVLLLMLNGVPALAQSALAAAVEDARNLPPEQRVLTRYLDLSNVPNAYKPEALKVLSFHANQLSTSPDLVKLRRPHEDLVAVVLADFGWRIKTWEALADIDPWYHVQLETVRNWPGGIWRGDGKFYAAGSFQVKGRFSASAFWLDAGQIAELITLTQSQVPIVRADWWFVQTARQLTLRNKESGAGYYDFLGVTDRDSYLRLARLSVKDSIAVGKETRAVLDKSGVAQQGRQLGRFQSVAGAAWFTLDAKDTSNGSNPVRLLGKNDYRHDAEEWFLGLANGLFAYGLFDADGKLQPSAPDFIGPDDSPLRTGRDGRIHVCLSCVRCHVEGLRPVDDWVRRTIKAPLDIQAITYEKALELRRQYGSNIERQLEKDRLVYEEAIKDVNGMTPGANARAFARFWDWYVQRERGVPEIAREMGVSEDRLQRALKRAASLGKLDAVAIGLLQVPESKLRVEHLEEVLPNLWQAVLDNP